MKLLADRVERLDRFLARVLPQHSRSKLARFIAAGNVSVDGAAQKASFSLAPGMQVSLDELEEAEAHDLTPADIPLDIVYEDKALLVVNKPRGLASHPAASLKEPSLVNALLARSHSLSTIGESYRPGIVHRLDKETTGLMLIAKTDEAHVSLARQIERKKAERRYVAVVAGDVAHEKLTINAPLARDPRNRIRMAVDPRGREAVTHVKRLVRLEMGWLLAIRLETGRTHQIRVHLSAVGNPVLGDAVYAPKPLSSGPLQLHAAYLAFDHPVSSERIKCYAPPPEDFLGAAWVGREAVELF